MPRLRPVPLLLAVFLAATALAAARPAAAEGPPRIRSVNPAHGLRGSTVDVAIEGQNLSPFEELKCTRGDLSMSVLPGPTPTRVMVRFVIPEGAEAGPVLVRLKTKDGIVTTEKFTVRMRLPVVTRVQPGAVTRGGDHTIVLTGAWLAFLGQDTRLTVEPPLKAKITGKPTDKSLTFLLTVPPDAPPGPASVVVETTDGKFTATVVVRLATPSVTGVAPAEVAKGTSVDVNVSGRFLSGAGPVVLAVPDEAVEVVNRGAPRADGVPIRVTVKPGAAPGPRTLVVRTPDGLATARLVVTAPVPRVVRLHPAGVPRGAVTTVDLVLENAPGDAAVRVVPDDPGVTVSREKDGRLRVTVAADAAPGPRTLLVDHPFGLATATLLVNMRGPTVTGMSPAEVAAGASAEVAIDGQDLGASEARLVVEDPAISVAPGPKPATLRVEVAAGARPGPRPFLVRTPEGAAIAVLVVPGAVAAPPSVSRVTTTHVPRGTATDVRLEGIHLREAGDRPPQVSLAVDGVAIPVEILASSPSSLHVRLTPPADAPLGGAAIVVRTSEGVAAGAVTLVPAVPWIESVAPAALPRSGAAAVVVSGRHLAGATAAFVRADGKGSVPVAVSDAKADRLAASVSVDPATPAGPWLLVLRTREGGTAAVVAVEPSLPDVDSVEPAIVGVPGNVLLTVRGRHLTGPGGRSPEVTVTRVGGASAIQPQVVTAGPDTLVVRVVTLPGTPPAPHVLVVRTLDGVASALFQVVGVPQPTPSALEPAEGTRGQAVVVTLRGIALTGLTDVTFSGKGVTGVVLPGGTDREMKVRVTVAADAAPGARSVTVATPGGFATIEKDGFTVR